VTGCLLRGLDRSGTLLTDQGKERPHAVQTKIPFRKTLRQAPRGFRNLDVPVLTRLEDRQSAQWLEYLSQLVHGRQARQMPQHFQTAVWTLKEDEEAADPDLRFKRR
jgi:hypothetical protein